MNRFSRGLHEPAAAARYLYCLAYNTVHDLGGRKRRAPAALPGLDEVRARAEMRTDINDHLETLFVEALAARPEVIVELGVRTGESTFVLERVARVCGSHLASVDIQDCSRASDYKSWTFVKSDDVAFGREFPTWAAARGMPAKVDVLFIDTSHLYEHTVEEIDVWFPHLSPRAKVFFHDTNQRRIYRRRDGSRGHGWANSRGVIRAIEERLGTRYDESRDFVDLRAGWIVRHDAVCNGFTVLERAPP